MDRYSIVIGNAYGDEGKGLVTDYLATPDAVVVRFSGGAQAGHTVQTPAGLRHVFSHFGAGTLRGAGTYLSRYFYCDPVLFTKEFDDLTAKGVKVPTVYIDPMCPVVTPMDVLLNQLTEAARARVHGSCGCGIGEAARRMEERPEKLVYSDLDSPLLGEKLAAIRAYVEGEAANRGLLDLPAKGFAAKLGRAIELFLGAVPLFLAMTHPERFSSVLHRGNPLVFEGSQGLLLDREIGAMPHVTRAHTGLRNVYALLGSDRLYMADVYFVSRCYLTRHGAGPLDRAGEVGPFPDETNVQNPWQGALRFAPYDAKLLAWARRRALDEVSDRPTVHVVTTCLDQIPDGGIVTERGWSMEEEDFDAISSLTVYGPTRDDVRDVRNPRFRKA